LHVYFNQRELAVDVFDVPRRHDWHGITISRGHLQQMDGVIRAHDSALAKLFVVNRSKHGVAIQRTAMDFSIPYWVLSDGLALKPDSFLLRTALRNYVWNFLHTPARRESFVFPPTSNTSAICIFVLDCLSNTPVLGTTMSMSHVGPSVPRLLTDRTRGVPYPGLDTTVTYGVSDHSSRMSSVEGFCRHIFLDTARHLKLLGGRGGLPHHIVILIDPEVFADDSGDRLHSRVDLPLPPWALERVPNLSSLLIIDNRLIGSDGATYEGREKIEESLLQQAHCAVLTNKDLWSPCMSFVTKFPGRIIPPDMRYDVELRTSGRWARVAKLILGYESEPPLKDDWNTRQIDFSVPWLTMTECNRRQPRLSQLITGVFSTVRAVYPHGSLLDQYRPNLEITVILLDPKPKVVCSFLLTLNTDIKWYQPMCMASPFTFPPG